VTRIAVVGPGGVGTFFAAHLASAGHDVVACSRRPFTEYIVESELAPVRGPANVVTDPDDLDGPVDWVLLAVKAHQTDSAAAWLEALCDPDTQVITVQNGVEGRTRAEPYVNGATVWLAVVYCGAELVAPGHSRHSSHGMLIVPDKPQMHELAALFEGTGARIKPDPDYITQLWRKLGVNTVVNGLSALTDKPIGVVGEPTLRPVAEQLLSECWAVAAAEGATLSDDDIAPALDAMVGVGGTTSMRVDRQKGRPTEYDALYGAVVRIGAKHGIATPTQALIGTLIAAGDPDPDTETDT
jgi:2-dehydropantoate 2-reductase